MDVIEAEIDRCRPGVELEVERSQSGATEIDRARARVELQVDVDASAPAGRRDSARSSRSPKAQNAPLPFGRLDLQRRHRSTLICGAARRPRPGRRPATPLPGPSRWSGCRSSSCRSTEPVPESPVPCRERRRAGIAPAGAGRHRADASAQQAADHQPERRRHDDSADEGESRPPQDEPDADADEDERPQAPEASDLVIRQVARSNGERDRPGEDQEDAPAQDSRDGRASRQR